MIFDDDELLVLARPVVEVKEEPSSFVDGFFLVASIRKYVWETCTKEKDLYAA